jgi:alpha-acetolactate decarboxylase
MFSLKTDTGLIALDGHIYKERVDGKVTVRTLTDEEMPEAYAKFGLKY